MKFGIAVAFVVLVMLGLLACIVVGLMKGHPVLAICATVAFFASLVHFYIGMPN